TAAGTVALVADVNPLYVANPSSSEGALQPGHYSFKAHYAGNAFYNPVDSDCEPLTITDTPPAINITKVADSAVVAVPGQVTYSYEVTNTSPAGPLDPLTITSLIDDNGTPCTAPNVPVNCAADDFTPIPVDSQPDGFNDGDTDKDGLLDFDETWLFTKTVQITTGSDGQIITNTVRVTANDDDPPNPTLPNFEAEAKDDATVRLRLTKPNVVTNSSLCQFDTDSSLDGHQFNQIFIQDSGSGFRLNATNPGQFYDNVLYAGNPGDNVTLTLKIPYPFVTQGA